MSEPIYLVYDVDGTSATGTKKLIGATTDRALAEMASAAIHQRNSWNSGAIVEVARLEDSK